MNRMLPVYFTLLAGIFGLILWMIDSGVRPFADPNRQSSASASPSPVASVSEERALIAARQQVKDEIALEQHDSDVLVRDGDFYVTFRTKKKAMGGAVVVWVDGQTGRVRESNWYQ